MAVSKPPISVTICYKITSTENIKYGHNQLSPICRLNLLSLIQTMTLCQNPGVRLNNSEHAITLKTCYMLHFKPCILIVKLIGILTVNKVNIVDVTGSFMSL